MTNDVAKIEVPKVPSLLLETNITARFVRATPCQTPEEQVALDAMNVHAEEISHRLQGVVRLMIIEMMDMKREMFTTKGENRA